MLSIHSPVVLPRCCDHSISWMHRLIEHSRQIFWRSCNHAVNYPHIHPTGTPHLVEGLYLCYRMSTA